MARTLTQPVSKPQRPKVSGWCARGGRGSNYKHGRCSSLTCTCRCHVELGPAR